MSRSLPSVRRLPPCCAGTAGSIHCSRSTVKQVKRVHRSLRSSSAQQVSLKAGCRLWVRYLVCLAEIVETHGPNGTALVHLGCRIFRSQGSQACEILPRLRSVGFDGQVATVRCHCRAYVCDCGNLRGQFSATAAHRCKSLATSTLGARRCV